MSWNKPSNNFAATWCYITRICLGPRHNKNKPASSCIKTYNGDNHLKSNAFGLYWWYNKLEKVSSDNYKNRPDDLFCKIFFCIIRNFDLNHSVLFNKKQVKKKSIHLKQSNFTQLVKAAFQKKTEIICTLKIC